MKRIIYICLIILLLTGCNSKKEVKVEAKKIIDNKIEEKIKEQYTDTNPIKLSLYVDKKKISEYISPMTIYKDIVSLECYFTEDDIINKGSFKDVFNNYYQNYQNIDDYRIGYYIHFKTTTSEISKYIYSPSDVESFFNYVQIYLYDDINQDSSWYDHVSKEEYNEKTLLTSIKLTASTDIDKVESDIEVTAFSYKKEDINDKGEYLGDSKYQVTIKHK